MVGRWKRGVWLMATVGTTAYFDESSVDQSHSVCVVAGFVASTDMWIGFEKLWKRALAKRGKLTWKKYVQAHPARFAEIAHGHTLKAIQFHCSHTLFRVMHDKHVRPIAKENRTNLVNLMDSPYAHCSAACCDILDNWARDKKLRRSIVPIKVIFDKGASHQVQLERGYKAYYKQKKGTYLIGEPIFESDDCLVPLQASHLLAWLLSKHYNNRTPENEALEIICKNNHMVMNK
jgi:hypothetical protein